MNILFIAQRIPFPANKGEKIRTFNQIKFLADLGHNITVLAPIENQQEQDFAQQLSAFERINCQYQQLSPKVLRLITGLLKNESLSVANFYQSTLQNKIDQTLQTINFDTIICTSSAVAKYVFNSKTLPELTIKPKLLMDFMDLDSDKWQQYADKTSWPMSYVYQREANLLKKYEKKVQQLFDACFFIADAEVNLFKQYAQQANNVHTLGNGMNTDEFYPAQILPNNNAPTFIFTGVMDYKPNVDAVVWFVEQCWPKVISQYPEAQFIIAGMNPNNTIMNLKKYAGIIITGFVDDILPYYHQADYFVAPFRLARGVQNKVLQAFACGLPVISTPMGAEGIECKHGEHILLAQTPDEFLQHINELEQNTDLKSTLSKNALTLIHDEFSWQGKLAPLQAVIAN